MAAYTDSSFSNPITKSGRVVYNVCLDLDHARWRGKAATSRFTAVKHCSTKVDDYILTVMPHEICLQQDQGIHKRGFTRSINDTEIQLLSCLNGLKTKITVVSNIRRDETLRRRVRRTLKFGGIAATDSQYAKYKFKPVANDAMFVSQFGGLCTIMNTGDGEIQAGDYVVWDLPKREREGCDLIGCKDKQLVITRPHINVSQSSAMLQRQAVNDEDLAGLIQRQEERLGGLPPGPQRKATLFEFAAELNDYMLEERSRVIGRALQGAKTGETFDLLLGRYIA